MPNRSVPVGRTRKGMKTFKWMVIAEFGTNLQTFFISCPIRPDEVSTRKMLGIPEHIEIYVGAP